jgi:hypothetical protein
MIDDAQADRVAVHGLGAFQASIIVTGLGDDADSNR